MVSAQIIDLTAIPPVDCPCGQARRALADYSPFPGTVHLTEISRSAVAHHHRDHTEIYVVLECEPDAAIELDGQTHPVRPLTLIAIPPGVVHRAIGEMKVLIVCHPEFDPADEHTVTSRTKIPIRTYTSEQEDHSLQ
ncbi:cupin domain-containing protein [Neorhodopirellula pilleata]|uniref:Cupin domain protein n=1 Tax=Neorhodopirellula pilleata TaxID=2714738 RepID=A0A5C6A8Z9_9BACT|nr:cupin domain-containing protein [Neorhodopirellula pilleata]TWT95521.1 Cupin domain protein [Neorhodopirellula pilleata]